MRILESDNDEPIWFNEQPLSLGRPPLEKPEGDGGFMISPEVDPDDDLPWELFPVIDDFEVVLEKLHRHAWDGSRYDVYFFSQECGIITVTMWNEADLCRDDFSIPFLCNDLDQGWQLDIFEKEGFVFIVESNWEAPEEGARRWYKVSPERYRAEWEVAIATCKQFNVTTPMKKPKRRTDLYTRMNLPPTSPIVLFYLRIHSFYYRTIHSIYAWRFNREQQCQRKAREKENQ